MGFIFVGIWFLVDRCKQSSITRVDPWLIPLIFYFHDLLVIVTFEMLLMMSWR
jgi:hypothetical protein